VSLWVRLAYKILTITVNSLAPFINAGMTDIARGAKVIRHLNVTSARTRASRAPPSFLSMGSVDFWIIPGGAPTKMPMRTAHRRIAWLVNGTRVVDTKHHPARAH
jgi:hypothetical protein